MDEYIKQIERFYKGILPSHDVIRIGQTPDYMMQLGAKQLPIIITQSNLKKCIREPKGSKSGHSLSRKIIEQIPEQLKTPILAINNVDRNSIVLISEIQDFKNDNLLMAIQLSQSHLGINVNEAKSIYGRTHLKEYLERQPVKDVYIVDNTKAKLLSRVIGLQLPQAWKVLDLTKNIASEKDSVNRKPSILNSLKEKQKELKPMHPQKDKKGFER